MSIKQKVRKSLDSTRDSFNKTLQKAESKGYHKWRLVSIIYAIYEVTFATLFQIFLICCILKINPYCRKELFADLPDESKKETGTTTTTKAPENAIDKALAAASPQQMKSYVAYLGLGVTMLMCIIHIFWGLLGVLILMTRSKVKTTRNYMYGCFFLYGIALVCFVYSCWFSGSHDIWVNLIFNLIPLPYGFWCLHKYVAKIRKERKKEKEEEREAKLARAALFEEQKGHDRDGSTLPKGSTATATTASPSASMSNAPSGSSLANQQKIQEVQEFRHKHKDKESDHDHKHKHPHPHHQPKEKDEHYDFHKKTTESNDDFF